MKMATTGTVATTGASTLHTIFYMESCGDVEVNNRGKSKKCSALECSLTELMSVAKRHNDWGGGH